MQEKAQLSNTNEQLKTTATQKQEGSKNKQFQSPYKTREGKLGPIQSKQGRKPPIQAKQRPVNKSNPEPRTIDPFEVKSNPTLEAYNQSMEKNYGFEANKTETTTEPTQRQTSELAEKAPQGSAKFQEIATTMGEQHGVDTSNLKVTHNSSFPESVNAKATIQGNKIDFAPGKDSEHNMKHEIGHYIDNAKNGTPKGDKVVNGQKVDTSRERVVDEMAKGSLQVNQTEAQNTREHQATKMSPVQRLVTVKEKEYNMDDYNILCRKYVKLKGKKMQKKMKAKLKEWLKYTKTFPHEFANDNDLFETLAGKKKPTERAKKNKASKKRTEKELAKIAETKEALDNRKARLKKFEQGKYESMYNSDAESLSKISSDSFYKLDPEKANGNDKSELKRLIDSQTLRLRGNSKRLKGTDILRMSYELVGDEVKENGADSSKNMDNNEKSDPTEKEYMHNFRDFKDFLEVSGKMAFNPITEERTVDSYEDKLFYKNDKPKFLTVGTRTNKNRLVSCSGSEILTQNDKIGESYKKYIEQLEKYKTSLSIDDKYIAEIFLKRFSSQDELGKRISSENGFMDLIDHLIILLFGVETSRNRLTYMTTPMLLKLIAKGKLTFKQAFDHNKYGGAFPMASLETGAGNFTYRKKMFFENKNRGEKLGLRYYRTDPKADQVILKEATLLAQFLKVNNKGFKNKREVKAYLKDFFRKFYGLGEKQAEMNLNSEFSVTNKDSERQMKIEDSNISSKSSQLPNQDAFETMDKHEADIKNEENDKSINNLDVKKLGEGITYKSKPNDIKTLQNNCLIEALLNRRLTNKNLTISSLRQNLADNHDQLIGHFLDAGNQQVLQAITQAYNELHNTRIVIFDDKGYHSVYESDEQGDLTHLTDEFIHTNIDPDRVITIKRINNNHFIRFD